MSRTAFVMDGHHNVTTLAEDSCCDNVLLEYNLALELNKLNNTAILPLFVGDKAGNGQHTHFFQSECMPKLQKDVVVRQISEKVEGYLEHAGVAKEQMPKRQSVKAIMDSITQFQGHFLQGNAYEAVKGAAQGIYECTVRLFNERRERRAVEIFKFSTPQGQEVFEWLADNRLLPFAPIFAQNKLNSLRKVSRLTHEEVVEVNEELYASQRKEQDAAVHQHGTRVALSDAIESLKGDLRAQTIQTQMHNYRDSKVSMLNMLGAQNQVSAVISKKPWLICWIFVMGIFSIWSVTSGLSLTTELSYTTINRSVLTYGVQLSKDSHTWQYVSCQRTNGGRCAFEISGTKSDVLATGLFPQDEEARYVRILPWTWNGMQDGRGADMRLGILGGDNGNLDYRVLSEGAFGEVWLQYGCTLNRDLGVDLLTRESGRWSLQDEKVGEVQCCLNTSRAHVCTRDGCLSGDKDDVKFSWHEAKAKCEARGWRLCRRDELERPGSAGCCTKTADGTDQCGYNKELVWTDDVGGTQTGNIRGRIDSDISMDRVFQVTVDLDRVQIVRGIQIQSGVPDVPYNGPSCMLKSVVYSCFTVSALFSFLFFSTQKPSIGGTGAILCWMLPTGSLLPMIHLIVIYNDPGVPSVFSKNPLCPGATLSNYYTIFDYFWFILAASLWAIFLAILQLL